MFDAKVLIQKTSIFQCSKNYGNPTRETNLKVAVNVANPNSLMKKTLVPLNNNYHHKDYEDNARHDYPILIAGSKSVVIVVS